MLTNLKVLALVLVVGCGGSTSDLHAPCAPPEEAGVWISRAASPSYIDVYAALDRAVGFMAERGYAMWRVEDSRDANVVVSWVPFGPERSGVIGAEYLVRDDGIRHVELNGDKLWTISSCAPGENAYDVETVLLHELGHAEGLVHVFDPSAIMYPYVTVCETRTEMGLASGRQGSGSCAAAYLPSEGNL